MDISKTALILVDMQNDYLHGDGAFRRAKLQLSNSRILIEQLIKVCDAVRNSEGRIISANFTLVADKDHNPIIPDTIKKDWPFLRRGDFQLGRWGHNLIDELAPADYVVNKITYSAFYMSHFDWLLQKLDIKTLLIGGILTNEGVASTIRDAQSRGYRTILLADGCSAFSEEIHQQSVQSLSSVCDTVKCQAVAKSIKSGSFAI